MPKEVTIILDSGCFLPKEGTHCEIGYFQCAPSEQDIEITVDDQVMKNSSPLKLGSGCCVVQIHHKDRAGVTKTNGIKIPVPFHDQLLHMNQLYPDHMKVDRKQFDCILLFRSGEFGVDDVRKRKFKRVKETKDDRLSTVAEEIKELDSVAHDVIVRFLLEDGESIVFTRDDVPFWSSGQFNKSLKIKICA